MTWFALDDQGAFGPKVLAAGNEAFGAFCRAGMWSSQHLTDGFVPHEVALAIAPAKTWAKLRDARVGHEHGLIEERPDGWQIHDFLDWNPSAADVRAERERKARNIADHRARKKSATNRAGGPPVTAPVTGYTTGHEPATQPDTNRGPDPDPRDQPETLSSLQAGEAPPAPPRDETPEAIQAAAEADDDDRGLDVWRLWDVAYRSRYGTAYLGSPQDQAEMPKILRHARETVSERERPPGDVAALLAHWFRAYLRDDGTRNFLADERHALRFLLRGVAKYGTPWDRPSGGASRPVERIPEPPPRPTPEQLAETARMARELADRAVGR